MTFEYVKIIDGDGTIGFKGALAMCSEKFEKERICENLADEARWYANILHKLKEIEELNSTIAGLNQEKSWFNKKYHKFSKADK